MAYELLNDGVKKAIHRLGWKELHSIQSQSIVNILTTSKDLIISAPTAGGKTEAAFLPILSILLENPNQVVIYVSPLKALINDQWSRLQILCDELDIHVWRWHGDILATEKKNFRNQAKGILLITPESLESNFINYGQALDRIYADTAFVVIDELHVFINDVRGMHLRSLISRLTAVADCSPRLIGLSATLGDSENAKQFIRPDNPSNVDLVADSKTGRDIRIGVLASIERKKQGTGDKLAPRLGIQEILQAYDSIDQHQWKSENPLATLGPNLGLPTSEIDAVPGDALDEIADDISVHFQSGNNLVFGNSKQTLEILVDLLHERANKESWSHDPFCVHHGSISKNAREDVEQELKDRKPTTALCTSTLELGIDIGNVRTVGQVDPPWSVSALVQRLGRSGRRKGEVARMRIYSRNETPHIDSTLTDLLFPSLLRSIAVIELMLQRWIEPNSEDRYHASTLIHQLFSLLKQTGGLAADVLFEILCLVGPFRQVDKKLFIPIIRDLGYGDLIEQIPTGEIILSPKGEYIASSYDFYAAFASQEMFKIRYDQEAIGELKADCVPPRNECFILNGRRWKVRDFSIQEKCVWVAPTKKRVPPNFEGDAGEIHTKVLQEMRNILRKDTNPKYLDKNAISLLNCARKAGYDSSASTTGIVETGSAIIWYPWVGTITLNTLVLILSTERIPHSSDKISIRLPKLRLEDFLDTCHRLANKNFNTRDLASKIELKQKDKFDAYLSEQTLDEINAHDRINLDEAIKALNRVSSKLD